MGEIVTTSISEAISQYLRLHAYSSIAVLVDENTERHCLPIISDFAPYSLIRIKSGEQNKKLTTCAHIWQAMTDLQMDRHALLINLGGGVIGDMGGFCAATYKRGIAFINIPTTLLSMVDASVGGKLGVDFGSFKNHIGLFQSPQSVMVDAVFLETLPERELFSGYAEVIKHALITSQSDWADVQEFSLQHPAWATLLQRSIDIKSAVVTKDWKEEGLRKTLNFGHTIGHAIESHYLEDEQVSVLHGEAVAAGIICELYLSGEKYGFSSADFKSIREYILKIYGKVVLDENDFHTMAQLATQDKKNENGEIRGVLLKAIGAPIIDSIITTEEIVKALQYYQALHI
jgi:3-dehydroquinate synthase